MAQYEEQVFSQLVHGRIDVAGIQRYTDLHSNLTPKYRYHSHHLPIL